MKHDKSFQKKRETDKFFQLLACFNDFAKRKNLFSAVLLKEEKEKINKEAQCLREFNFLYSEKNELLYKKIVGKISRLLDVRKCILFIFDKPNNEMILQESCGLSINSSSVLMLNENNCEQVINKYLNNVFRTSEYIYSDITLKGNIIGLIAIAEKNTVESFNSNDIYYLEICCGQIAYSVENNKLVAELCSKANLESSINKMTSNIRSSLDLDEILSNAAKEIKSTLEVDKCSIIKFENNRCDFLVSDVDSINSETLPSSMKFPLSLSPIYNRLALTMSVIALNDVSSSNLISDEMFFSYMKDISYAKSLLIVPLIYENNLCGMILVSEFNRHIKWKKEDILLMEKVSFSISTAIYQAEFVKGIKNLANIDELTGLINRRGLMDRFTSESERIGRNQQIMSFALLDIDHFKMFNDQWGHLAGDYVLTQVGNMIKSNIRKCDFAARYGGEEFALILPETSIAEAYELLDRLRNKISMQNFEFEGHKLSVSISAGVIEINPFLSVHQETKDFMKYTIEKADNLLYRAKDSGRNKVCIA
ncbi:MAG: sensor domain-containing diguanylate cyclase [bacterium]